MFVGCFVAECVRAFNAVLTISTRASVRSRSRCHVYRWAIERLYGCVPVRACARARVYIGAYYMKIIRLVSRWPVVVWLGDPRPTHSGPGPGSRPPRPHQSHQSRDSG